MQKIILGLMILFSLSYGVNNKDMKLEVPEVGNSSMSFPVTIVIQNGLNKGDILIVKSNKKTAFELRSSLNGIIKIKTKLRLIPGHYITAILIRRDGTFESISKDVRSGDDLSDMGSDGNPSKKIKIKVKKNKIKFIIINQMAKKNYVDKLVLAGNDGIIEIKMTSMLSKNPYFQLIRNKNFAKLKTNISLSTKEYDPDDYINKTVFVKESNKNKLLEFVKEDISNIQYIKNPSEELQFFVVNQNTKHLTSEAMGREHNAGLIIDSIHLCNIRYINSPSKKIKELASKGSCDKYIK